MLHRSQGCISSSFLDEEDFFLFSSSALYFPFLCANYKTEKTHLDFNALSAYLRLQTENVLEEKQKGNNFAESFSQNNCFHAGQEKCTNTRTKLKFDFKEFSLNLSDVSNVKK